LQVFLKAKWDLQINGSVLIANPVPKEMEIPFHEIESKIQQALNEAKSAGISW